VTELLLTEVAGLRLVGRQVVYTAAPNTDITAPLFIWIGRRLAILVGMAMAVALLGGSRISSSFCHGGGNNFK
jgi:hypothetical protein